MATPDTNETGIDEVQAVSVHPTFWEALLFWLKLGFISFGGPAGQIAIMQTELVEKRRWISQDRFIHALNYCMLLPGPEAQQLTIYIGWLLHRTWGGIVAGVLFVLPSAVILWVLSYVYVAHGEVAWVASIFYGLKPAVMALVAFAVLRIGKKVLKNGIMYLLAAVAFVGLFFLKLPFVAIIVGAGAVGYVGGKRWPGKFLIMTGHGGEKTSAQKSILDDDVATPEHARPTLGRALRVIALSLVLWWTPVLLAGLWLGYDHTLVKEGIFFSKAAMVTFGGAYAVLPYVSQQAVEQFAWLQPGQMLDGLGLAESTPGPLIMVTQFVGFLGGWNHPGALSPLMAATLGAAMTTWCTFVPCFLWIFLGAPHIEQLRGNKTVTAVLSAITAAVVGVVLNLAIWFGLHVVVTEDGRPNYFGIAVGLVAFVGLWRWKWDVVPVVLGAGAAGLLWQTVLPLVLR